MAEGSKFGPWDLSAEELRKITKWPNQVIEDYLFLQRQVAENTTNINVVIEQITNNITNNIQSQVTSVINIQTGIAQQAEQAQASIGRLQAQAAGFMKSFAALNELIATSGIEQVAAQQSAQAKILTNLGESIAAFNSLPARLSALQATALRGITDLQEQNAQLSGNVMLLQAQLAKLTARTADNEQLLAGLL